MLNGKNRRKRITLESLQRFWFPFTLFWVAFLPRAIYPVSLDPTWFQRSIGFLNAILHLDWAGTYFAPHPGVIVMWLSGLAEGLYYWLQLVVLGSPKWPLDAIEPMTFDRVIVGVLPLALIIALCIVMIFHLLSTLLGKKIALLGSLLIALDPFHIVNSKVIHPEGLLSIFMATSALFLLNYLRDRNHRSLLLSGFFGGLALLTKTPGMFLVPFLFLALAVGYLQTVVETYRAYRQISSALLFKGIVMDILKPVSLWLLVMTVTTFLLWPSMWVQPLTNIHEMFGRTALYSATPHENPNFFMGQVTTEDPGPLFYVMVLLFKSTMVTLPLSLITTCCLPFKTLDKERRTTLWLLVSYAFFFGLQMTLGVKKGNRYLLPIFPILDILAAVGVIYLSRSLGRWLVPQWEKKIGVAMAILAVLAQSLVSLPRHPYYGTHYNHLLGGARVALTIFPGMGKGEGVDLAARYLNQKPQVEKLVVGAQDIYTLAQHFKGETVIIADPRARYLVFDRNHLMRKLSAWMWEDLWAKHQDRIPEKVIEFDGIPYVWVYEQVVDRVDDSIFSYLAPYWNDFQSDRVVCISGISFADVTPDTFEISSEMDSLQIKWFDRRTSLIFPGDERPAWYILGNSIPLMPGLEEALFADASTVAERYLPDGRFVCSILRLETQAALQERIEAFSQTSPVMVSPEIEFMPGDPQGLRQPLTLPVDFGHQVELLGYELATEKVATGQELILVTFWQVLEKPESPLCIFVHLLDARSQVWGQHDGLDVPSAGWEPGDIFVQMHRFSMDPEAPPGEYQLEAGLYSKVNLQRLAVFEGEAALADRVLLQPITVAKP